MKLNLRLHQVLVPGLLFLLAIPSVPAKNHIRVSDSTAKKASAYSRQVLHKAQQRHSNYRTVSYVHNYSGGGGGDYLSQMGGESRWPEGKTIRIYVAPGRSSARSMIASCMNTWKNAAGNRFNWTLTSSPYDADYTIGWTTHQKEVSSGTEAGLTTTDTEVDPGTGMEYIDHAHTNILTWYEGKTLSDGELAQTLLHEVGHALGLEGHSSNPTDIMYYAVSSRQSGSLTGRDRNTMSRLYSMQ